MKKLKSKSFAEVIDDAGGIEGFRSKLRENRGILNPEENLDRYIPSKTPYITEEGICLFNHAGSEYFIGWERVNTPISLLMFIHHLSKKIWINRSIIQFLVEEVCHKYNWGYFGIDKNQD